MNQSFIATNYASGVLMDTSGASSIEIDTIIVNVTFTGTVLISGCITNTAGNYILINNSAFNGSLTAGTVALGSAAAILAGIVAKQNNDQITISYSKSNFSMAAPAQNTVSCMVYTGVFVNTSNT
jgi:hypothetical protein